MKRYTFGLALMLFALAGFSQETDTKMFWAGGHIGMFKTVKDIGGFSGGLSLNALEGSNIYKARYFYDESFELWEPTEKYTEISVLAGKSFYSKFFQINLSGGLGVTFGELVAKTTITEYKKESTSMGQWSNTTTVRTHEFEKFTTPSIPVEAEFLIKPLKAIGLGLTFSGNLNLERPTFRTTLSFNIGKLR